MTLPPDPPDWRAICEREQSQLDPVPAHMRERTDAFTVIAWILGIAAGIAMVIVIAIAVAECIIFS
jgi:hypothetical protein